jgi:hypothetical protein
MNLGWWRRREQVLRGVVDFALRKPALRGAAQRFRNTARPATLVPPAAARAEFSPRENCHHSS